MTNAWCNAASLSSLSGLGLALQAAVTATPLMGAATGIARVQAIPTCTLNPFTDKGVKTAEKWDKVCQLYQIKNTPQLLMLCWSESKRKLARAGCQTRDFELFSSKNDVFLFILLFKEKYMNRYGLVEDRTIGFISEVIAVVKNSDSIVFTLLQTLQPFFYSCTH